MNLMLKLTTISLSLIALFLYSSTAIATPVSIKLQDNIAQGYGMINLFTPHNTSKTTGQLNGQTLQALREQHGGILAFVIDVNEAANGTEKAASQGVAIADATLIFNFPGNVVRCGKYTTSTASLLAISGQTTRVEYPTLIGATGSNLITPSTNSDLYGTDFSAIMRMKLDNEGCTQALPNLSTLTSAFLEIHFVDTNTRLGDPEAFYDFTNGPEDIALISTVDVPVVEQKQAGIAEAPLVIAKSQVTNSVTSWQYYPSDGSYYVVSYEDKYPVRGDYDFNDLVVGYRVGIGIVYNSTLQQNQVTSIVATGYMIARGSEYTHDWYLRIPVNTPVQGTVTKNLFVENSIAQVSGFPQTQTITGDINIQVLKNTKQLMAVTGQSFVNTLAAQPLVQGKKFSFALNLDTPILLSEIAAPPYDPYLHVNQTNYEIHLPGNRAQLATSANLASDTTFKDTNGFPYALLAPDDWHPPLEGTDLGLAYTKFIDYTATPNNSNETWYLSPTLEKIKTIGRTFWGW